MCLSHVGVFRQTVIAAASVACVAACRGLVERGRAKVFLAQEQRHLSDEVVKRETQVCPFVRMRVCAFVVGGIGGGWGGTHNSTVHGIVANYAWRIRHGVIWAGSGVGGGGRVQIYGDGSDYARRVTVDQSVAPVLKLANERIIGLLRPR